MIPEPTSEDLARDAIGDYFPHEFRRNEPLTEYDQKFCWLKRAVTAERERDEAQKHCSNHHLEQCETCIATESELISLRKWKQEALTLLVQYDEIAEPFGEQLGRSKVDILREGVEGLRAEVERMKSEIILWQRSAWIALTDDQREELSKMEWGR